MSRPQAISTALLVVVALLVGYLAWRNRQPPLLPRDAEHGGRSIPACLSCHGPDGESPQSPNHPLAQDCFRCHGSG